MFTQNRIFFYFYVHAKSQKIIYLNTVPAINKKFVRLYRGLLYFVVIDTTIKSNEKYNKEALIPGFQKPTNFKNKAQSKQLLFCLKDADHKFEANHGCYARLKNNDYLVKHAHACDDKTAKRIKFVAQQHGVYEAFDDWMMDIDVERWNNDITLNEIIDEMRYLLHNEFRNKKTSYQLKQKIFEILQTKTQKKIKEQKFEQSQIKIESSKYKETKFKEKPLVILDDDNKDIEHYNYNQNDVNETQKVLMNEAIKSSIQTFKQENKQNDNNDTLDNNNNFNFGFELQNNRNKNKPLFIEKQRNYIEITDDSNNNEDESTESDNAPILASSDNIQSPIVQQVKLYHLQKKKNDLEDKMEEFTMYADALKSNILTNKKRKKFYYNFMLQAINKLIQP